MNTLQPLPEGLVLIAGAKSSNFDDEIKTHPRVVIWDSQHEHWTNKDLPQNTRAVFVTRFIGHNAFENIIKEARKRKITIFNPEGTGMIVKQVKELLNIDPPKAPEEKPTKEHGKLKPLIPLIDFTQSNVAGARLLMIHAKGLGINTTEQSLSILIGKHRKKSSGVTAVPRSIQPKLDVSVEILDNAIKELTDMREFLIATVEENKTLKTKLAKFKSLMED